MKRPWIICALMGWGLFALAVFAPQQAPAGQDRGNGGDGGSGSGSLTSCVGDINNDTLINIDDLVLVITNWGSCPGACQTASQCNDNDPCTLDTCQMGQCVHTPIANCCQSAAQCAGLFPNAQGVCQASQCVMGPCNPGFLNCNGMNNDGCEVNVVSDPANCGGCNISVNDGNPCTFDSCNNGVPVHQQAPNNFPCGVLANCVQPVCISGNCVPMNAANGTVCATATQCASFFCNNGVCTQVNQANGTPCGIGQQCMNGNCQ